MNIYLTQLKAITLFKNIFSAFKNKRVNSHNNTLKELNLDWSVYAKKYNIDGIDLCITDYLENYLNNSILIPDFFDSEFYVKNNLDVRQSNENPLLHFITHGQKEGRKGILIPAKFSSDIANKKSSNKTNRPVEWFIHPKLDWENYKIKYSLKPNENPVQHFDKNWKDLKPEFSGFFSTKTYLLNYRDILASGMNPLLHFVNHGIYEGRYAWFNTERNLLSDSTILNLDLETRIIMFHDASRTGAPFVSLNLVKSFKENYNIISIVLKDGDLIPKIKEESNRTYLLNELHGSGSFYNLLSELQKELKIEAIIFNSVESTRLIEATIEFDIPIISLIHEYAEYTRPLGKMSKALEYSDKIIFPSKSLEKSAIKELQKIRYINQTPNNTLICPQGKMDIGEIESITKTEFRKEYNIDTDTILISGAGFIQERKGFDWFITTAAKIIELNKENPKGNLKFVWFGQFQNNEAIDFEFWSSLYLGKRNIESYFIFPGHVKNIDKIFEEVDIYLLTSKLDPFPNVAIDAILADCGFGGFEEASGITDFIQDHKGRYCVAKYGDCDELAHKVYNNLDFLNTKNGENKLIVKKHLKKDNLIKTINKALLYSQKKRQLIKEIINSNNHSFSNSFDEKYAIANNINFFSPIRNYLIKYMSGLSYIKPFPGSNPQKILERFNSIESISKNLETFEQNNLNILFLDDSKDVKKEKKLGKIAIHFHVFYNDIIDNYLTYFHKLKSAKIDIFITHINDFSSSEILKIKNATFGKCKFIKIENQGRNIYPFIKIFKEKIYNNYSVVGHFHTKKSKDLTLNSGANWANYILENSIGSENSAFQILNKFTNPTIGMIYPEEYHCVDEGANKDFIKELSDQLGIVLHNPIYNFPVGCMFWSNVKALAKLKDLDLKMFELKEPIPYDGSILHAFERILPSISEHSGYKNLKTYKKYTKR